MTSISIASWRSAANRIQDRAVTEAVKQAEGEGDQSRKISALKYALDHWATRAWWTSRMVCVIACLSLAAIPPQQSKVLLPSSFIFNGWLHFRISLCQALGQSKWAKKANEKRKKRASSPYAVFFTFFFDPFSPLSWSMEQAISGFKSLNIACLWLLFLVLCFEKAHKRLLR